MRKNSIKNTRINGEVQKELSTIIRNEIKDPRIHPMTSVMAVEVAPDLKTCRAYISVLGEKEAKEATIKGLNSAEGYIRRQLARNLNLRNTPEIRFILDESMSERTFLRYGGRFCRARIVRVPCRNLRRTGACRPTRRCGRARGGNMRKNTYLWSSEHSAEAGLRGRAPAREAGPAIGRVGRTAGGLWGEGSLSYDHGQIGP